MDVYECLLSNRVKVVASSGLPLQWDDPRQQRGNGKGVQMARAAQCKPVVSVLVRGIHHRWIFHLSERENKIW